MRSVKYMYFIPAYIILRLLAESDHASAKFWRSRARNVKCEGVDRPSSIPRVSFFTKHHVVSYECLDYAPSLGLSIVTKPFGRNGTADRNAVTASSRLSVRTLGTFVLSLSVRSSRIKRDCSNCSCTAAVAALCPSAPRTAHARHVLGAGRKRRGQCLCTLGRTTICGFFAHRLALMAAMPGEKNTL